MACFCQECSLEHFGVDYKDFARPDAEPLPEGYGWPELCEGCGEMILVDNDGKRLQSCRDSSMERPVDVDAAYRDKQSLQWLRDEEPPF